MKVQIVIERGQVRLLTPVYLKPDADSRIDVEIDDDAIATTRDWFPGDSGDPDKTIRPDAKPGSLQAELNDILGPLARRRSSASIGDDHQVLRDAFEDRYSGR